MKTSRGFKYYEFKDLYGEKCSIQKSSLATRDALWLGLNVAKNHPETGEPLSPRMHVDRKLAKRLIKHLTKFIETGNI